MRLKILIICGLALLLAGCSATLQRHELAKEEKRPNLSYGTWLYMAGESNKSRAVFLLHPEAKVDVVADSATMTQTTSTYEGAVAFMNEEKGFRKVTTEVVNLNGKFVGYLLFYEDGFNAVAGASKTVIDLYESKGKIYFKARERLD